MISRLTLKNLRGVVSGAIGDLAPLTLLTGPNNSGKSTILEALLLLGRGTNAATAGTVLSRRGWVGLEGALRFAHDPNQSIELWSQDVAGQWFGTISLSRVVDGGLLDEIRGRSEFEDRIQLTVGMGTTDRSADAVSKVVIGSNGERATLTFAQPVTSDLTAPRVLIDAGGVTSLPELEDAYSAVVDRGEGGEAQLDHLASELDPTRPKLRIMKTGSRSVLHAVRKDGAVPLYFEGDGFKRLVLIACRLAGTTGGLVLLEDPECYLHPAYLGRLAALTLAAVEQGTQIVMTTHSVELMRKLLLPGAPHLDRTALFTVRLREGVLETNRLPGPAASERLHELGEDLRM
jgi:energy-coupling factor transporter ATP-binding protein EcfA2